MTFYNTIVIKSHAYILRKKVALQIEFFKPTI